MKRLLIMIIVLALLVSLTACGADDPNAGIYDAVSCTASGLKLDCEGEWLELKKNGKASLYLAGEEYNCSWSLEGENLTIKNWGDEFTGTVRNGIITLDYGDMIYIYIMDGYTTEAGEFRGHIHHWKKAVCEMPKICTDCGATDGEPLGHSFTEANYQDAPVCTACGTVSGEVLQPDMEKYGITDFMEVGVIYPYTTVTGKNPEKETTGELQILSYEIFKSSEQYPEKEGYEWRVIQVQADFFDYNARTWGIDVGLCYEDYYTVELSDDSYSYNDKTKLSSRMILFHGEQVPIYYQEYGEWSGWKTIDNRYQQRYTLTRAWLVPEGYDGSVIGFFNEYAVDWDDKHIYEVYDPATFWMFRLN